VAPGAVVVGTGFGCRVHVPALRAAGFDVVALVGRDPERTARRAARVNVDRTFTSLADALGACDAEAVTIATPPDTHAALAIDACNAGRNVVCEKPFALDRNEAARMLDAATRAQVTHLVGHEFRWTPDRATVARAIGDGLIGDARTFSLVQYVPFVADPAARVPRWWFDADRGGGWLGASGSHVVDQIRMWLGEFASVSAVLPSRHGQAEDSFVVRATMANGAEGVALQTAASWGAAGLTVVAGTRGTLEIGSSGVWLTDADGRRLLEAHEPVTPSDDPRERFTHLELGPYTKLCEALRGLPSAVPPPTFADGVACMRVLDAIRASAAAGGATVTVAE
jgi:predicted dehydrogenase